MNPTIKAFAALGTYLQNQLTAPSEAFLLVLQKAEAENGWFSPENLRYALTSWANELQENKLCQWLSPYNINTQTPKQIALILAGNIPLVGFHDFLSVICSGHTAVVRLSSADKVLLPFLSEKLIEFAPFLNQYIHFTQEKISQFDAVIATGSNNTARYFEYYFQGKPSIIRKSRNSVAVLTGNETQSELTKLANDIFLYFGLGCRSVSKLFVPQGYNFTAFFEAIFPYAKLLNHTKYANNYDYNKAVYLMSLFNITENGFLLLKEDTAYASPIATVFYEYYSNKEELIAKLHSHTEQIQCIVGEGFLPFGSTQTPSLTDYADGVDTIAFLTHL